MTSLREASTAYLTYRDECGLGASDGPLDHGCITRGKNLVAVIDYQGGVVLYAEGSTIRGYIGNPTVGVLRRATSADLNEVS